MITDVRGGAQIIVVASNQYAILAEYQVWFNVIRTHLDGQLVSLQRVLRQVSTGTPVSNHQRIGSDWNSKQEKWKQTR